MNQQPLFGAEYKLKEKTSEQIISLKEKTGSRIKEQVDPEVKRKRPRLHPDGNSFSETFLKSALENTVNFLIYRNSSPQ